MNTLDEEEYSKRVLARASSQFHGENVVLHHILGSISAFAEAGKHLDLYKKALFYGKKLENAPTEGYGDNCNCEQLIHLTDVELFHALVGLLTEAGEIAEAMLKYLPTQYDEKLGGEIDTVNLQEELGDLNWYRVLALSRLEQSEGQNRFQNDRKLEKRYGPAFTEQAANERDLAAERAVLEGHE